MNDHPPNCYCDFCDWCGTEAEGLPILTPEDRARNRAEHERLVAENLRRNPHLRKPESV